jgi:hypothetical protein
LDGYPVIAVLFGKKLRFGGAFSVGQVSGREAQSCQENTVIVTGFHPRVSKLSRKRGYCDRFQAKSLKAVKKTR